MENQVAYAAGTQLIDQANIDDQLTYGKGWSYGVEFFVKKNTGRFNGWLSYTWSKTEQQFDDLNFGEKFPFKYDRRHNVSLVGIYNLNKKWSFSSNFVYSTGSAFTLPVGRINGANTGDLYDGIYSVYTERNNYRLNAYHRLDVAATYKKRAKIFKKEYDAEWVFSIYNLYSRQNTYYVFLEVNKKDNKPVEKQVSLLPIIPSVTYNFKF